MFENIIAEILNRLLGSYVTSNSFQSDRVSTSVYQGHVSLSKLELRPDALDRLLLPITLKRGTIQSVEVSIPWTALGSKSLEITLDGVSLVLNPKTDWTDEELERREHAAKTAQLLQAEMVRGINFKDDKHTSNNHSGSFTSRIMDRMVSNVIVRISNVHIRFETLQSSFTLSFKRFEMQNTDSEWLPSYSQDVHPQYKLVKLEQVALFDEDRTTHVLLPVDLAIKMQTAQKDLASKIALQIDHPLQVFVVQAQLEHFVEIAKLRAFSKHRPTQSPLIAPRQWWQYVGQIVLKRVRDKRYRKTKAYFTKRRRDRLEYTFLWKQSLSKMSLDRSNSSSGGGGGGGGSAGLSLNDKARLDFLERCLDLSDILLFRSYAENELRLEKAHQELWEMSTAAAAQQQQHRQAQPTSESGWISWALGMRSRAGSNNPKESLSQQDVERFLTLLRYNPAKSVLESAGGNEPALGKASPPQHVVVNIPVVSVVWSPAMRIRLERIHFELQKRGARTSTKCSLGSLQVFDVLQQVVGASMQPPHLLPPPLSFPQTPLRNAKRPITMELDLDDSTLPPLANSPIPLPLSDQVHLWLDVATLGPKRTPLRRTKDDRDTESKNSDSTHNGNVWTLLQDKILDLSFVEDAGAKSLTLQVGALEVTLTELLLSRAQAIGKLVASFEARSTRSSTKTLDPAVAPTTAAGAASKSTNVEVTLQGLRIRLPLGEQSPATSNQFLALSVGQCTVKDQFVKEDDDMSSNDDENDEEDGGEGNSSDQFLVRIHDVKLVLQRNCSSSNNSMRKLLLPPPIQLLDPFTIRVLINVKKRGASEGAASYRIDLPEVLQFRLYPVAVKLLHDQVMYMSASKSPIVVVESWAKSWLVSPLPEDSTATTKTDVYDKVFTMNVLDEDVSGSNDVAMEAESNGSEGEVSDFFTVYDDFVDSMSEISKAPPPPPFAFNSNPLTSRLSSSFPSRRDEMDASHYSFFTADTRRTRKSRRNKTNRLASISTARSKTNFKVKIPGIRIHYYDVDIAETTSAATTTPLRTAAPDLLLKQKPVAPATASQRFVASSVVSSPRLGRKPLSSASSSVHLPLHFQDWLDEAQAANDEEEISRPSSTANNALLVLKLDMLDFEWSQRHHHFSLGQISCRSSTNSEGGKCQDTYLFTSEFALDKDMTLVNADHMERAVFFSVDWDGTVSSAKTHIPLDVMVTNFDKLFDILPHHQQEGGATSAPQVGVQRTLLHTLLSVNQVRVWLQSDTFFTLSNIEFAGKREQTKLELKGRIGNVSAHHATTCFYSKLALEEEDLVSLVYVFPQVEVRPISEDDELMETALMDVHDEVLDSILGVPHESEFITTTYDVWQQGMEVSVTIAPVRVNVRVLYDIVQQQARLQQGSSKPSVSDKTAAKEEKKSVIRFHLNVLQPEFELGLEGVSLVCERIGVENAHYLCCAQDDDDDDDNSAMVVVERIDAAVHQVTLVKENAEDYALPLIDPSLLEIRAHKVKNRVAVSMSDFNLNIDHDQLVRVHQTMQQQGSNDSEEQDEVPQESNNSKSDLDVTVQVTRFNANLIVYTLPSANRAQVSVRRTQSNAHGLVAQRTLADYRSLRHLGDVRGNGTRPNYHCLASIVAEDIGFHMQCGGGDRLALQVDSFAVVVANSLRIVDLQYGVTFSKQGNVIDLCVIEPKFRFDMPTWQDLQSFLTVKSSASVPAPTAAPAKKSNPLTFRLSVSHLELWLLPPNVTMGQTMLTVYVSNVDMSFTSLAKFSLELNGISSWLRLFAVPQEEAKVRFVCYPFNVKMPHTEEAKEMTITPMRFQATRKDLEAIWGLFPPELSTTASAPAPGRVPTPELEVVATTPSSSSSPPIALDAKLVMRSIEFVLLSDFSLPVVQFIFAQLELTSTQSLVHGRVRVKAEFYKRQCWQALMEEVLFAFHLNNHNLSITSTNCMEWNLCESLLDHQLDGRVKIKTLVNHTGMLVERIDHQYQQPTSAATVGDSEKDFFCSVGELLSFRLTSERAGGAAFVLRNVACPKPGQTNKVALTMQRDAFLVMETKDDLLILRSLLQVRNDSANTMEVFVAEPQGPSRPDTPTTTGNSQYSSSEDFGTTPSRRRSRVIQLPGVLWSSQVFPNETVYIPPATAHLVLVHALPLSIRPYTSWGMADYEFKDLKVSHSARQNEKRLRRTLSFGEAQHSSTSSVSSTISDTPATQFVHYAVDGKWLDAFSQCIVLSAPLILVNHLNCPATYCLEGGLHQHLAHYQIPRCEGQLPVGAELKWHGVLLPHQATQLRLSLRIHGYEWSTPTQICGAGKVMELALKDESNRILRVNASVVMDSKQRVEITFWVPYWIVNKTTLPVLCSSNSTFGVMAGQNKVLATMRRIRLQSQLQSRSGSNASWPSSSSSSSSSMTTTSTPTGLLEILEDEQVEETFLLFTKPDLKIRFWNSRWSTNSCFFEHNSLTVLECKQEWKLTSPGSPRALYTVSAKVSDSKFPETKIVTLTPRFILVNALDRAVRIRQAKPGLMDELGSSGFSTASKSHPLFSGNREPVSNARDDVLRSGAGVVSLVPGASSPFHWRDKSSPKQISACFEEFGWEWSSGVEIDDCVGEFCSRLRNRLTNHVYILRVEVQVEGASVVVTLREELPELPPYRIDNLSLFTLRFRQVGATGSETLLPYHSSSYSWDLLNNANRLLVVEALPRRSQDEENIGGGGEQRLASLLPSAVATGQGFRWLAPTTWFARPKELGAFSLDHKFGFLPSNLPNLSVSLQADGPTRVLTICDSRVSRGEGGISLLTKDEFPHAAAAAQKLGFYFKMGGIGISLVEDGDDEQVRRRELLRIFISHPSVSLLRQVQLESIATGNGGMASNKSLTKAAQAASIVVGNIFELRLREVQIDNQLLSAPYPVLLCSSSREEHTAPIMAAGANDMIVIRLVKSNRFASSLEFIKSFTVKLAPVQLNLDAEILKATMGLANRVAKKLPQHLPSPPQPAAPAAAPSEVKAAPKKIYIEDLRIDEIHVRINFRNVLSLVRGNAVGNPWFDTSVEGAVLCLRAFHIEHSLLSAASDPIASRVLAHYLQSLRRHWYVLISSVDLFGDPVGLGKTVSQGIMSALQELHAAVVSLNPLTVARSVCHGTWLVARAVISGTTNSFVNMANGITGPLVSMAQSPYVQFPPPRHLFDSIAQGIAGFVVHPFESLRQRREGESRVAALLYGTFKGTVGVIVHPLIGWLRLAVRIASAVRASVDPSSKVRTLRTRTPRFFRPDQRIRMYDPVRARGEEALWLVGRGKQLHWSKHLDLDERLLVVFTDSKLVVLKRRDLFTTRNGLHVYVEIDKLDFVCANVVAHSDDLPVELKLVVLQSKALAFRTITLRCSSAAVALLAKEMANAW